MELYRNTLRRHLYNGGWRATASLVICVVMLLGACAAPAAEVSRSLKLVYLRWAAGAVPEVVLWDDENFSEINLALDLPAGCMVWNLNPAPQGGLLALELACGSGPKVVILDVASGETAIPAEEYESDSRFLAWSPDGESLYLKVDTLGDPRVVRADAGSGRAQVLPLPQTTYDLAISPEGGQLLYSFTQGIGFGSETWLAESDGRPIRPLLADPLNIIAFARPSPDGSRIAYLRIPDTQVPFSIGELWVMQADGTESRFLAYADAGHGYAPAWSPDSIQIACVVRDNPDDLQADQSAAALISNIQIIESESGEVVAATRFDQALVESPLWSPEGQWLAFDAVIDGTINLWLFEPASGEMQPFSDNAFACCPAWLPGK